MMKTGKSIQIAKSALVGLAALASLWAAYTTFVHFKMGRMIFVDFALPRRSFKPFIDGISEQVRDDVMTAHERGLHMVAIPLIIAAILWLGAYLMTEWQRRNKD